MIRFIITALFVILFLILSIPLLIAEWIIGKFNPPLKDRSSLAIVNWAFRMVLRLSGVSQRPHGQNGGNAHAESEDGQQCAHRVFPQIEHRQLRRVP